MSQTQCFAFDGRLKISLITGVPNSSRSKFVFAGRRQNFACDCAAHETESIHIGPVPIIIVTQRDD